MTSNLVIIEQDAIDQMEEELSVLGEILGIDFNAALTTDESSLSDFCFSGAEYTSALGQSPEKTLEELYDHWDHWALSKLNQAGYPVESTRITLVDLCRMVYTRVFSTSNTRH